MSKKADNRLYNAERKAQAELIKRDLDRDKLITQLYQESYDRLQAQIDKFYLGYAGREGLTKQEAMKRASEFDVTKFAEKARKAVKEKDFSHKTNSWLRVYNLKMKVSRLELLKAELGLEINSLTSNLDEVFDKARRREYLAEYKRQAGILGVSSSGATKRLESSLYADFYGQNFSSRVWGKNGLQSMLQKDVFASLNRIYTDMNGYQKEMKLLANKYGSSEASAKRLLKTEIARINADTDHAVLKDNGFTHMIFVAESGACDICKPLDNTAVPIDKVEKGVNMFPMHPNCRCSAYGHIKMDYKAGGSTLDREAPNGVWEHSVVPEFKYEPKQITGNKNKALLYSESYRSVKDEWLSNTNPSEAKVSEINFWEQDGKKYYVDGHNVKFEPSRRERELAYLVVSELGSHVQLNPKVENPSGIPVPDYLIDGVRYDAKEIEGVGKNNIDTAIKGRKKQAHSFIIDITKTEMDVSGALERIGRIYRNHNRRWVDNIILVEGDEIIDIFRRK